MTSKHIDLGRDQLALEAEYFQTPQWAIDAILDRELFSGRVVDPCCGDGRIINSVRRRFNVATYQSDKYHWGECGVALHDWLEPTLPEQWNLNHAKDLTFIMNPPFSLATQFVDRCRDFDARKIICFQRQVWRESATRRAWWAINPPNRIYICGDRANCWIGTIPEDERKGGMYQPHAWYVWERGHPPGTLTTAIYRT